MHMHIRHETRYHYERPVKYSVQSLHLTPRRDLSQRALSWSIAAPGRRLEQIDAYGNIAHLLTVEEPHREISIVVRGIVETADNEARQDDGPLSPLAYLAATHLTSPNEDIKAFAYASLASAPTATPHGFACLTITQAGTSNVFTHSHAASASAILLYDSSLPCNCL